MKKHTFRALALPGILLVLAGSSAPAQVPNRNAITPRTPPPSQPQIITPPPNHKATIQSTIVTPGTGTIVSHPPMIPPGGVIIFNPGYVYPGTSVVSPIVPTYPSAMIGPTIVRETHSEPAPNPAVANVPMPALRLVAVVGMLRRLDVATGADRGLVEMPLGVSVGVLAGYSQNQAVRASGDFFGTSWDGPTFFARAEDNRQGPFLDHPILTVNEFKPGPWDFEMGTSGRRVAWIRVALDLFEDNSQNGEANPVNLPHGRRAAMREVLQRVTWTDKHVSAKSPVADEAASTAGADLTYFGKALATFTEKTMAPSDDNQRIGVAEWFFPAQDVAKVLADCPRFTETPDGPKLREIRAAAGGAMPDWVRACEFHTDTERYIAELWFIIVPDTAITTWLQRK